MKPFVRATNVDQQRYVTWLIQAVVLMGIIAFERVAGLPILFLGLTMQMVEPTKQAGRRMLLIAASLLLALFYQLSLVTSFLLLGLGVLVWLGLGQFSSSKTARVLVSVAVMVTVLVVHQKIAVTVRTTLYSSVSAIILISLIRSGQQQGWWFKQVKKL